MLLPATADTIVGVSTGWNPAALGIVRLSGPDAHDLVRRIEVGIGDHPPADRGVRCRTVRIAIEPGLTLPATLLSFFSPRSYTGQDLAEIHTVGCLPLLRALCERLIALGARPALPGEFTARAFVAGRMNHEQVDAVLALIRAGDAAQSRAAARLARGERRRRHDELIARLTDLLALVEAGIDFVDEEDVRFISPAELRAALDELLRRLDACEASPRLLRPDRPHVALAGPANAGKSTLFNALVGCNRAIVSPIIGTTRDVLEAEVDLGVTVVLQDCAGLADDPDALAAAAHVAGRQAASRADVVLWVHDRTRAWHPHETDACESVPEQRRILVLTRLDVTPARPIVPIAFRETLDVTCVTGAGLDQLRRCIARALDRPHAPAPADRTSIRDARRYLRAARLRARPAERQLRSPELIAADLRSALVALSADAPAPSPDEILGRIMTQFCVGK